MYGGMKMLRKEDIDDLEYQIEIAKLDNAARYLEVPGSQMSPAHIADIGVKGNILEVLGNSTTLLRRLLKVQEKKD